LEGPPTKANIYVCDEQFEENIVVQSGITLYGGLHCNNGWTYTGGAQTRLLGSGFPPVMRFLDGPNTTTVYDMDVTAADGSSAGVSSAGASVEGGTVVFVRVDVLAGNGTAGAAGSTPADNIGPSDPNDVAIKGNAPGTNTFCTGNLAEFSAPSKANPMCPSSIGGASGAGEAGVVAPQPGSQGQVAGGAGGTPTGGGATVCNATGCSCESNGVGTAGGSGASGANGAGATTLGMFGSTGWWGAEGAQGATGNNGRGGGGGAGAFSGPSNTCGRGGSGGGAGGCGGFGGTGGQAGGGSFAVYVLSGSFSTIGGSLSTKSGGKGGDGGLGQTGGVGGNGGTGGACAGGKGGTGGAGGRGGGGAGGHSVAVLYAPNTTITIDGTTTLAVGTPGAGGMGGDANGIGVAGRSQATWEFPTN
jgi:hypothetical protein